jgi:ankyrin repeat-rich membrane spanning protein
LENELPPFKNEASDLNMLLEDEDYFSDLSPRAMQKMMNIIRITGRLLKAFDVDFTWEDLSCWVNVTERWPYKLSWICIYCLVCENQILEEYTLLSIYNKIRHLIPGHHLDKNSNLDACDNKLSWYLEEHRSSLTVANLFTFLPYTISLDPYLRKEIMKKFRPDENFFTNCTFSGTAIESTESIISEAGITPGSRSSGGTDPNMSEDTIGRITSFKQLGQVDLEDLSAESVVELFLGLKGFSFNAEVFRNIIRENGINGNVLKCCDLQDLKRVLNMNFGDWEMFKMAVGILRQNSVA